MPRAEWTAAQRHGALLLVCLVGIFNLMDRQVMTILLESAPYALAMVERIRKSRDRMDEPSLVFRF